MSEYQKLQKEPIGFQLKFLLKDTFIYGFSRIINRFVSVFTLPLLATIFTKTEFGLYDALLSFGGFVTIAAIMGQQATTARFINEEEDFNYKSKIVLHTLTISGLAALIQLIFILFCVNLIAKFYIGYINPEVTLCLQILTIAAFFNSLFDNLQTINRLVFNRLDFVLLSFAQVLFYLIFTYLSVWLFKKSIALVFASSALSFVFTASWSLYRNKKYLSAHFDMKIFKELFLFGLPYVFIALLLSFFPIADRYFITHYMSLEKLAYYSIAQKVALIVYIPLTAFQIAWPAFAYSIYKRPDASKTFGTIMLLYFSGILSFIFIILLLKKVIIGIISVKYLNTEAEQIVLPILFQIFFQALILVTGLGVDLAKKTMVNLFIYIFACAIGFGVAIFLTPILGLWGICLADLTLLIIIWSAKTAIAYKLHPIRFHLLRPVILLLVSIPIIVVYEYYINLILLKLCLFLFYLVSVYFLFYKKNERKFAQKTIRNLLIKIKSFNKS